MVGVNDESLYRSAQMSLVQFYMPTESAHATVSELAELGNVQFKDVSRRAAAAAIVRKYSLC